MATVSEAMDLDTPVPLSDVEIRRDRGATPPSVSLDDLPVEILMQVASSLDYSSLLSLERVSERCRAAVAVPFRRVTVFDIVEDTDKIMDADIALSSEWTNLSRAQKALLLSRLTALCELGVYVGDVGEMQWILEAMLAASTGWSWLKKLTLYGYAEELVPALLGQICSNCTRLTDVTLHECVSDEVVEAMLTARRGELRSLELEQTFDPLPDRLVANLVGCIRLERLCLYPVNSVINRLPPEGLPMLRHLDLTDCCLTNDDLTWLVERQPDLETLIVNGCGRSCRRCEGDSDINNVTPSGLEQLCRLTTLTSLTLEYVTGLSDELLRLLSKMPLTLLHLDLWPSFWEHVTAAGLYRFAQESRFLRWVTLTKDYEPSDEDRTIDCRSRFMRKQDLLRILEEHITSDCDLVCCHFSGGSSGVVEKSKSSF